MNRNGFSLVELSIVLVILGLLTGGILAGQSLIRASELRAVTAEYQRYATAANTFRDKYFAIPGDFRDATRFWNRLNTGGDCVSNSGLGTAGTPGACDGDGDGAIEYAGAASQSGELFQFWRHLALAGLIEGSFTGVAGAGATDASTININVPASKLGSAGWSTAYLSSAFAGNGSRYAIGLGNYLQFGAPLSIAGPPMEMAIKPEEAWNIDTKMDDGKPAQGSVIALYWNNQCAAADDGTHANTDLVSSYVLSDSRNRCALNFRNAF